MSSRLRSQSEGASDIRGRPIVEALSPDGGTATLCVAPPYPGYDWRYSRCSRENRATV